MAIFDGNMPYTNLHELNLDWIIKTVMKIKDEWESFGYSVTATSVVGEIPKVVVTGDLINGLNFEFTLVRGEKGDKGDTGNTGNGIDRVTINPASQITFYFTDGTSFTTPSLKGDTGSGLEVLDVYPTLSALQTAHPTGSAGNMYLVGTSPNFILYLWSTANNAWVEGGALSSPSPSTTTPLMDGEATTGSEYAYARGDHTHPTDTTRASVEQLNRKQDTLISGTNIKTVNSQSLLGTGNIQTLQLESIYPVGSIYMNATVDVNPAELFGFGTWTKLKDMFLLGAGDVYQLQSTGGEAVHQLTVAEMPSHSHTIQGGGTNLSLVGGSGNYRIPFYTDGGPTQVVSLPMGSNVAHNNMPPYLVVNIWRRTA